MAENKKIKIYIVTYKANELLKDCIESILSSDISNFEYEINVINNYQNLSINHEKISVLNNDARPDFSTGHLSRNWNQAIINGFVDIHKPDCDILVCIQSDEVLEKDWASKLVFIHENYDFLSMGPGDAFHSYTIESIKKVGLWDERFCNIGYQEADYFLRQAKYNQKKCSINDFHHGRIHNTVYEKKFVENSPFENLHILKNTEPGYTRQDDSHLKSAEFHNFSNYILRRKWGIDNSYKIEQHLKNRLVVFQRWPSAEIVDIKEHARGEEKYTQAEIADPDFINSIFCKEGQDVFYPYFEYKLLENVGAYKKNPYLGFCKLKISKEFFEKSPYVKEEYWQKINAVTKSDDLLTKTLMRCDIGFCDKNVHGKTILKMPEDIDEKIKSRIKVMAVGIDSFHSVKKVSEYFSEALCFDMTYKNVKSHNEEIAKSKIKNIEVQKCVDLDFKSSRKFSIVTVSNFLEYIHSRELRILALINISKNIEEGGLLVIKNQYSGLDKKLQKNSDILGLEKKQVFQLEDYGFLDKDISTFLKMSGIQFESSREISFGDLTNHYIYTDSIDSKNYITSYYIKR